MRRFQPVFIVAALALGLAPLAGVHASQYDKVNGSIQVDAGQQVGNVSTVNGSVNVAEGATIQKASTVNGSIELGNKAQASQIGTVNGGISLGDHARVSGTIDAVNGHIELASGADVGGKLSNVNGTIELNTAHVGGGISTVSGDIDIGANSRVEGGILVEKPSGFFHSSSRDPEIVIGPHAVVQGTLEFRREVVLKVSDSAQIGPVKGATPVKFSGATP
jgi:predicted acyltransferase (DUF342 family)